MNTWDDLLFWKSMAWDYTQESLDNLIKNKIGFCPHRNDVFKAMDATPLDKVRVAFIGQDPYPNPDHATGMAFSVPEHVTEFPKSLDNIFKEYLVDVEGTWYPTKGSLWPWAKQGVFLWNVYPTCEWGKPLSHADWPGWLQLTKEIVEILSEKGVVFVLFGARAQRFRDYINEDNSEVIAVAHPSPRSYHLFKGCRLFSRVNAQLEIEGEHPIDWRLT